MVNNSQRLVSIIIAVAVFLTINGFNPIVVKADPGDPDSIHEWVMRYDSYISEKCPVCETVADEVYEYECEKCGPLKQYAQMDAKK